MYWKKLHVHLKHVISTGLDDKPTFADPKCQQRTRSIRVSAHTHLLREMSVCTREEGGSATSISQAGINAEIRNLRRENGKLRSQVIKFTAQVTTLAGNNGRAAAEYLKNPQGIAIDEHGSLIIADSSYHRVRKLTLVPNAQMTTLAGNGRSGFADGDASLMNSPCGLAIDAEGNIAVADTQNNRIRLVSVDGTISTIAGSGRAGHSGQFFSPALLATSLHSSIIHVASSCRWNRRASHSRSNVELAQWDCDR